MESYQLIARISQYIQSNKDSQEEEAWHHATTKVTEQADNKLPNAKGPERILKDGQFIKYNKIVDNHRQKIEKKEGSDDEEEDKVQDIRYFDNNINIKCYNCQKYGHTSMFCPNPRVEYNCTTCGKKGHHFRDCPNAVICFRCNKPGHRASDCKEKITMICEKCKYNGHNKYLCLKPPYDINKQNLQKFVCLECGNPDHIVCNFKLGESFAVSWKDHTATQEPDKGKEEEKAKPSKSTSINDCLENDNKDDLQLNIEPGEINDPMEFQRRAIKKVIKKTPTYKRFCYNCGSTQHISVDCKEYEKKSLDSMRERFQQHLRRSPDSSRRQKRYRKLSKSDISDISSDDRDYQRGKKKKTQSPFDNQSSYKSQNSSYSNQSPYRNRSPYNQSPHRNQSSYHNQSPYRSYKNQGSYR